MTYKSADLNYLHFILKKEKHLWKLLLALANFGYPHYFGKNKIRHT